MIITQTPSPNYSKRGGYRPKIIVIHCTDGYFPSDLEWLRNKDSQVSTHYYISPEGEIYQLVNDHLCAWHAGHIVKPTFKYLKKNTNVNRYSLGIEISLKMPNEILLVQWNKLKELVEQLCISYNIPIDRNHIIGHREIKSIKVCPGSISVDRLVDEINSEKFENNNLYQKLFNSLRKLLYFLKRSR